MPKWLRKYPMAGMLAVLAAGILVAYHAGWLGQSDWVDDTEPQVRRVQVLQTPVPRTKTDQLFVRLADGHEAVLFVWRDSTLHPIAAGDILMVRTAITRPQPADAYSFDYGRYLTLQGMVGSGYVPRGGVVWMGHEDLRGLRPTMQRWRDRIERRLESFPLRERGVLESLLLGDRRRLSAVTREAFAASGAMHVLAVSGLHVGVITQLLLFVLTLGYLRKPLIPEKGKRCLLAAAMTGILVLYAMLTGLAPSVCRSVLMFIFLIWGKIIRPHQNTYNTLAASAVVILLVRPLDLFQPGFLLSYSAVWAIVRFQPSLQLWYVKPWIQRPWDLVMVSLCAQLGTLPWTIYFFHRVSNWFVLTNIGVLPLVEFLIIPTFFVFLLLGGVPVIGPTVGWLLEKETWVMNEYVEWVQALPLASVEVYLTGLETALLIAIVLSFGLKWKKKWLISAGLTVAFVVVLWADYRQVAEETETIEYSRGQNHAVLVRTGREAVVMSNDSTYALDATHDYRLAKRVRKVEGYERL